MRDASRIAHGVRGGALPFNWCVPTELAWHLQLELARDIRVHIDGDAAAEAAANRVGLGAVVQPETQELQSRFQRTFSRGAWTRGVAVRNGMCPAVGQRGAHLPPRLRRALANELCEVPVLAEGRRLEHAVGRRRSHARYGTPGGRWPGEETRHRHTSAWTLRSSASCARRASTPCESAPPVALICLRLR